MSHTASVREWIEIGDAARHLGVSLTLLKRRAPEMGIRIRLIPGCVRRKAHLGDVSRCLAEMEARELEAVERAAEQSANRPKRVIGKPLNGAGATRENNGKGAQPQQQ